MLPSIALLFLTATAALPSGHCDTKLINNTPREVEIGDYESSATPPPPAIAGQLYALAASNVAECVSGPQHFQDSTIRDLLQAGNLAMLSAKAYFQAGNSTRACAVLREGQEYFVQAYRANPSSKLDTLALDGNRKHVSALRELTSSRCQRE